MSRTTARILLVFLVLTLAVLACIGGGEGGSGSRWVKTSTDNQGALQVQSTAMAGYATATYGAQQFHLQLTAIAEQAP